MKSADVAMLATNDGIDGEGLGAVARDATDLQSALIVTGSVKWFDATRGFGFIASDNGGGDVLLHYSVLREIGRRSLPEGARVECLAMRRERGLQARRVLTFDLSTATGPDIEAMAARAISCSISRYSEIMAVVRSPRVRA